MKFIISNNKPPSQQRKIFFIGYYLVSATSLEEAVDLYKKHFSLGNITDHPATERGLFREISISGKTYKTEFIAANFDGVFASAFCNCFSWE